MFERTELAAAGSEQRRYSFWIECEAGEHAFVIHYQQGNNHWESGDTTATLAMLRDDWPTYCELLLRCGCAWAIPIIEEGFGSQDEVSVIHKLRQWSKGLEGLQSER